MTRHIRLLLTCALAMVGTMLTCVATADLAEASAAMPSIQTEDQSLSCPQGWTFLPMTVTIDRLLTCKQPLGRVVLYNETKQVWRVSSLVSPDRTFPWYIQTWQSHVFHSSVGNVPYAYFAPGEAAYIPQGYQSFSLQADPNLTALWKTESKLRSTVTGYIKNSATRLITKNSNGRAALLACTTAAWSSVKTAKTFSSEPEVEDVIEQGIETAANTTKCNSAIDKARGVENPKVVVLESQLGKIEQELEESKTLSADLSELVDALHYLVKFK